MDLKNRQMDHGWCKQDEDHFVAVFEAELEKVYNFVAQKLQDGIIPRMNACEQELAAPGASAPETKRRLANRLADILVLVNDLARFYQLNQKGFEKMVKKHDRWTQLNLRDRYMRTMQAKYPLDALSQQFDEIVVRISQANDQCDSHPLPAPPLSSSREQVEFERATAKYWVHPDNITEVKAIILFHLPVHVYNSKKQYEANDAAISSVYFDNPEFDLYSERLARLEGAEAIRFRWYGQETKDIYIERKTHHAPWLDGHSVKDRFRLKEHQVSAYMRGTHTPEHIVADLRRAGADELSIKQQAFVAEGVQRSMTNRRLKPMCRVFYNRTAFQRPGDQRLRISLDCNLTFIREDCIGDGQWRRSDVGIDYPFHHVPEKDIHRFPYAVLETKIQTHLGQETPLWLDKLLSSHLVHEVPRFSKYLHGASQLFPNKVPIHPWWDEVLGIDIRKPPIPGVGLSRSLSLQPLVNGHHRHSLFMPSSSAAARGNRDEPKHLTIHLAGSQHDGHTPAKRQHTGDLLSRFYPKLLLDKSKKKISETSLPWPGSSRTAEPRAPVRNVMRKIEPKTFFANERTFISWLQFCALLLTVALNLLNNGDHISRVIGGVFIVMSSMLCFYALARYQFRAWQLRTGRYVIRYDDLYGPTVLCICLVTALCVNFYLRLPVIQDTPIP
ncbi:VTC domain-containing protein [Dichotomocladium elegans]|nr:VTC domain-containing protein [Dichotomocladium elegans]